MKDKRERKYYVIIVIIVCLYWFATEFIVETPAFSTRITTTTTLIAAVTFWLQFKRTEKLNEANFIMNLNKQFIDNRELTRVEHALEMYANTVGKSENCDGVELKLDLSPDGKDRQALVDYLVYMEALSAIIQQGVMHLGIVDNLFAYRFFLAINNPIVQKVELVPFRPYYEGCYTLAKTWTAQMTTQSRDIPLKHFPLWENPEVKKVKK